MTTPKPRRSAGQVKMRLVHYLTLTPEEHKEMLLYGHITTGSGHGLRAVWEPVIRHHIQASKKGKNK